MSILERSSNMTIERSHFTSIGGAQNNVYNGDVVHCSMNHRERQSTIWDEYTRVPIGNVYIKRTFCDTHVRRDDDHRENRRWRNLDARRTISTTCIKLNGQDEKSEYLYIAYTGPDASKAFQKDFQQFSRVKNNNFAQLFGYNDCPRLPALIFYDALVPASHIFERNGFSSILFTYFCHQLGIAQGLDAEMLLSELWIDPRTGSVRKGPYVENSSNIHYRAVSLRRHSHPNHDHPPLSLQTYNNTSILFNYLVRTLSVKSILEGISRSTRTTIEPVNDGGAIHMLSSLPGTVYHRTSRDIIARWPGDRRGWYYQFWDEGCNMPDAMQRRNVVMEDGTVRFTLVPSDIHGLQWFDLYYDLHPRMEWHDTVDSWLSQAHCIFHRLGITRDEWKEYSVVDSFLLLFKCDSPPRRNRNPANVLIYLFIRPIPRPADDESKWKAWLEGKKFYWSFDSSGFKEMPEDVQFDLGLPSFVTGIEVWHDWWDRDAYDAIRLVHLSQGLNSSATSLAISLGRQLLEIGDASRFEEIDGDAGCLRSDQTGTKSSQSSAAKHVLQRLRKMKIPKMMKPWSWMSKSKRSSLRVEAPTIV